MEPNNDQATNFAPLRAPLEAEEPNADKLVNLAIFPRRLASESKSTVLNNSVSLVEHVTLNRLNLLTNRSAKADFQLPYGWVEIQVIRRGSKKAGKSIQ